MKVVGFLKLHSDPFVCTSQSYSYSDIYEENNDVNSVIRYLEKGIVILKFISEVYDQDGERIGPYMILSDGAWIWPSYYSYYLKKEKNILIPSDLKAHVIRSTGSDVLIDGEQKLYIEYMVSKILGLKHMSRHLPESVKHKISLYGETLECY